MLLENIAAIDIGTSNIKILIAKKSLQNFKVLSLASQDIDLSLPYDEGVNGALKEILSEYNLSNFKVITNAPLEKSIVRNLSFPFNDIEKISATIPFEVQETIPLDISEIKYDFQRLAGSKDNREIFLAAVKNDLLDSIVETFKNFSIKPVFIGVESNSLFDCYNYFTKIENENAILLDMGFSKSIVNIVVNKKLSLTRAIPIGTKHFIESIALSLKIPFDEAKVIFEKLHLDISSLDNNLNKHFYKEIDLKKTQLKKIFTEVNNHVEKLCEQILITCESYEASHEEVKFNRVLISGGGSNISGLGSVLTKYLDSPVVSMPFLEKYRNDPGASNFPLSLGLLINYTKNKNKSIDFLSKNVMASHGGINIKQFYMAILFGSLSVILLLVNLLFSSYFKSGDQEKYDRILRSKFKRLFKVKTIKKDPITDAKKMLNNEKKYVKEIESIIPPDQPTLKYFSDILEHFNFESDFELINIVINKNIVQIIGYAGDNNDIDRFKNKLTKTEKFESVNYNTRAGKKNMTWFRMTIKPRGLKKKSKSKKNK